MIAAARAKDWPTARALQSRFAQLMKANFCEPSPAPAKAMLNLMGQMNDTVRLPIVPATAAAREKLTAIAAELGLLKTASV